MNWGLTQGILGRNRSTLAPSALALGPNRYLTQRDFLKMLGLAFLIHLGVFVIAAMLPNDTVTNIPVRALSFKLGDEQKVSAAAPALIASAPAPAPVARPVMQATNADTWQASPNKPAPELPAPLKRAPKPEAPKPTPKPPRVVKVMDPAPAVAPTPQQYVREVGAPSPQVVANVTNPPNAGIAPQASADAQTTQAIRARYEQAISSWIQQHKYYPPAAGGREGRAIVRMRIDRMGNVRYYAVEQSAGLVALDDAALDMIRRANPVPAVPDSYPAGNLVEFLIPITFRAPL
jgi:protein TonB